VEEPAHNNVNILLVLEKWQDKEAWQFLHKFSNACLLSSQSHFSIMSTEKPGQRLNIYLHHYKKIAALQEGTVDHKSMEVRMPAGIIPECLNGNYDSRYTGFLAKGYLETFCQSLCHTLAQPSKQLPIIEEAPAQGLGEKGIFSK
jgi:hypothetical protein